MKEKFREIKLSKSNKQRLELINSIIREYQRQGYILTLRQLYYQLVSREVIPNRVSEYAKLSNLLKEGRMAGIVDWGAIEDRLRVPKSPAKWESPEEIMDAVTSQYRKDRMKSQTSYLEVWVEKDALSGVLSRVTSVYGVPILVNRGYSSVSAIYDAYNRFSEQIKDGKSVEIIYLGDFDPSGMDMIRDIWQRPMEMLCAQSRRFSDAYSAWAEKEHGGEADAEDFLRDKYYDEKEFPLAYESCDGDEYYFEPIQAWLHEIFKVTPVALTREQIRAYNPPPNPAKKTDPRSKGFIAEHGGSSWEVDALRPEVLNQLLTSAIEQRVDMDAYEEVIKEEKIDKAKLRKAKDSLADIAVDDSELEDEEDDN